ncbi:MAG: NAD-binding protein [Micrococcales bacterium]|nr:NAD-binding protein [Micrococcales bacterium]
MANPLLTLMTLRSAGARRNSLRRVAVKVPTNGPTTDAIFLAFRRMRGPLIVMIVTFSISILGLSLIPGTDDQGKPYQMTVFDSFYVISYTATTIGFGETPYTFSVAQRMWVAFAIYASVIGWAYAISALFSLLQDHSFREAVAVQRFRRAVARIDEPFFIVAGYGHTGRRVAKALDELGRRFVVLDEDDRRIDALSNEQLLVDSPGLDGDAANPRLLGLAGLGHPKCEGVLALTDDNETNLAIVMAVHLLRPQVTVIARCDDREIAARMLDFEPDAVINPFDRYGSYLVLSLQRPITYQLVSWLMNPRGTRLPARREGLTDGRWVVTGDDRFATEVSADLEDAGLDVTLTKAADGYPDVCAAVGFVAGASSDATSLSLAAHARRERPDIFLSVRQSMSRNDSLLDAFDPDSVFVPTQLVARETLARVVAPYLWGFIEQAGEQGEEWSAAMLQVLRRRCGSATPSTQLVTLDRVGAPAVVRWLGHDELRLGDLLRDPDDRDSLTPVAALVLIREEHTLYAPDLQERLQPGDLLLLAGREPGLDILSGTLYSDSAVEYVATGRSVPSAWVWRALSGTHRR